MTYDLDRTNRKNTGKAFEHELELLFKVLESRRVARIRKVDPPTRIVGGGFRRHVIFLPNPFLDYAGTLCRTGRAVFIEAKSTASHRLPIARHGGVTEEQVEALRGWARAGALVGVLWRFDGETAFASMTEIEVALLAGEKSLVFANLPRVEKLEAILTGAGPFSALHPPPGPA